MRAIAGVIYYVLLWLRAPIQIVLTLGRGFLFLTMLIVGGCYLALPQQRHTSGELFLIASGGSFLCFMVGRFYDRAIAKISTYRYVAAIRAAEVR
jgi:hypothetical protein